VASDTAGRDRSRDIIRGLLSTEQSDGTRRFATVKQLHKIKFSILAFEILINKRLQDLNPVKKFERE